MRDVRLLQAYKGFEETDINHKPGSRNLGGEQMADNKKYYYLKLKEDFFDSDEMLLLQGMKDGYLYSDILMKMYLRSLKNEGRLMYKDYIPYSLEMISTITRHQVGTVERAMKIFEQLKLVEVLDTLTDREQKVLRLRFGLDDGRARTLEEVGKEFSVTRERIRQIEAKALRKLRHPSRSRKLKDFLED